MKKNKRNAFLTVEDIRRANAQVMGAIEKPVLSDEDRVFLGQVKRVVGPIKNDSRLRELYRDAMVR